MNKLSSFFIVLKKGLLFWMAKKNRVFCKALNPKPNSASFRITERCNLRCIMCGIWKKQTGDELTTEQAKIIIKQIADIGVRQLSFTGGEPFTRPDIYDLVLYSKNMGLEVGLGTNGLLINEDNATRLLECGLNTIAISIDGQKINHDYIRGEGSFEKSLASLKLLSTLRNKYSFNLKASFTIMQRNLDDILPCVHLLTAIKNVTVHFNLLDFTPYHFRHSKNEDLILNDFKKLDNILDNLLILKMQKHFLLDINRTFIDFAKRYFRDHRQQKIPCCLGYLRLHIDSSGQLLPCWAMPPVADLKTKSLKKVLRGRFYKDYLFQMLNKKCPGCSCATVNNAAHYLPGVFERNMRLLFKTWKSR